MIFNGERTLYNIKLQNSMLLGIPYTILKNTTLNEKFNIEKNFIYEPGESYDYPIINLLTIGYTKKINYDLPNNVTRLNLNRSAHRSIDAALFNHIPFYLRKTSELTTYPIPDKCKLRTTIEYNGESYLAAYGYHLSNPITDPNILTFKDIKNDYVNITKISENTNDILNPTPLPDTALNIDNVKYIADLVKFMVFFTEYELSELKHVFDVLYPGEAPFITELGVCSSRLLDLSGYIEHVHTQINYFLDADIDIDKAMLDKYLEFYIEIGGMEVIDI